MEFLSNCHILLPILIGGFLIEEIATLIFLFLPDLKQSTALNFLEQEDLGSRTLSFYNETLHLESTRAQIYIIMPLSR